MRFFYLLTVAVVAALSLAAQDIKLPASLDQLSAKAKNVVDVNLDGALLKLAGKFLSDKDPDEAQAKKLVTGLKGIFVRSYEFDETGQYDTNDIAQIRNQLKSSNWTQVISVHNKKEGENSDIFIKNDGANIAGLVVLVEEPKELTIVNISGQINPEQLGELSGHFGIPKIGDSSDKKKDGKEDHE